MFLSGILADLHPKVTLSKFLIPAVSFKESALLQGPSFPSRLSAICSPASPPENALPMLGWSQRWLQILLLTISLHRSQILRDLWAMQVKPGTRRPFCNS